MSTLKELIAAMPDSPGVYIMKDEQGQILYVGKAKSLKQRLASYIGRGLSAKTLALMSHVRDIDYTVCASESIALLREAHLIKEHKPKYNVSLRDDKSYPLVKMTNEDFPALFVTRKREADGARYFGPYTNVRLLRHALKIIRRYFPYRSCRMLPRKACMYYRLGLSPAPCEGRITRRAYDRILRKIALVLEGRVDTLVRALTVQMNHKARQQHFEEAAALRDTIIALGSLNSGYHQQDSGVRELKELLGLRVLPERIEAFDVSNIYGQEACASMVSFFRGAADKNNYRRFRIKRVTSIDDYGMIREAVRRRYSRLVREHLPLPDLILIDGGKGHLLCAAGELKAAGLSCPLISIAKEEEHIYVLGRQQPISFASDTPALNLIRRIRDEAHRFAVAYHHVLRRKRIIGK